MTLGKRLSSLRKQRGLTQQQLGEQLNLSAQAVSKWENDLAEPDLMTLRALASLYKLTIDELTSTDDNAPPATPAQDNVNSKEAKSEQTQEPASSEPKTLGFCKRCGVAITQSNLGTSTPFMKCKKCNLIEKTEAVKAKEAEIRKKKAEEIARAEKFVKTQDDIKWIRTKSFVWAGIGAGLFLLITVFIAISISSFTPAVVGICGGGLIFMFISMLFYDAPVANVVEYMCTASIHWPGLIFTFDFDGFMWLIKMKILFAVLGFLFGLCCSILGIIIGLIISPFVFPYIMVRMHYDIKNATKKDYMESPL